MSLELSILVPSIPSRLTQLSVLFDELHRQADGQPVEVLCFIDNKKRSIGLKREALVQAAQGRFVAFVDDDDWVEPDYVEQILAAAATDPTPDCIVFDQCVVLNDGDPVVVRHGVELENTQVDITSDPAATRKPWHVMAYSREIAQECHFPDASYGEDGHWVEQAWHLVKNQYRIPKILHHYRFHADTTEAEIVYPDE